jgi:hypothetical protein
VDEIDRIQLKLSALAQAQSALLNQSPPDISGFQRVAAQISDLQFRMLALAGQPQIPALDDDEVAGLQQAVRLLAAAVQASAGATQILQAATAVARS